MQSVRLVRSRSGTSAVPRRQPATAVAAIPQLPDPFSSNSSSSGRRAAMFRSKSTTKDRPPGPLVDSSSPSTSALRRACKENCRVMSPRLPLPDATTGRPKQKATPPSAWALSPGRSPLRASTAPPTVGRTKRSSGLISPWARSPGRSPPRKLVTDPPRPVIMAAAGGKKGGFGGGMLGLFRRKKESTTRNEEEEASHQLRMLASRLAQWRFANARAEAAMEATRCNSEEKVFHAWLKIYELRNLVAAKRILVQRRMQRLKMAQVLNPQLLLLSQWEPQAKKHIEAVTTLGKVLGAAALALPMVHGAQADMRSIHQYISIALKIMNNIASNIGEFYTTVKEIDSKLRELTKTTLLELEGLEQLKNMHRRVTTMEIHEVSLMAQLIQAAKEEDSFHCSHQSSAYIAGICYQ